MSRHIQFIAVAACLCLASCGRTASKRAPVPADPGEGQVDFAELNAFAKRANAAYDTPESIRQRYPGTVVVSSPGKFDVQYFVERDGQAKTQYVTIRGTANRQNVVEDVQVGAHKTGTVTIPLAFADIARTLYEDAAHSLDKQSKTYVAGHSLGGAVAAILSLHLIADGYDVERVVTFGQPRFLTSVGLENEGVRTLADKLTRVVDRNDVVPRLPLGRYEHVGREIILLEGPYFVYLQNHSADHIALRSGDLGFIDHKMDHYVERLRPKLSTSTSVRYEDRDKYLKKHRN